MKKSIHSPFRKLKLLLVIPLMALVFYAFAKPEYRTSQEASLITDQRTLVSDNQDSQSGTVKGIVITADGNPLAGTSVIIKGTTTGTITDKDGRFKLKDVPKNGELVFSFVGKKTVLLTPDFENGMVIKMEPATVSVDKVTVSGKETSINKALYVVDGTIVPESFVKAMDPEKFKSINVLKGEQATSKYGEKGANGVIEVTLKKEIPDSGNPDSTGYDSVVNAFDPLKAPIYILDGVIIEKTKADKYFAEGVESVKVWKGKEATDKYGEKAKYGAVEIKSKKGPKSTGATDSPMKIVQIGSGNTQNPPLYLLDGKPIDKAKMETLKPEQIQSVNVLKDKTATDKYGEKGKNGVVEIYSKGNKSADNEISDSKVFKVVEEMPQYPGGHQAMMKYIGANVKYPAKATLEKAEGMVVVNFVIKSSGKVEDVKVVRGVHPALDAEALRVISNMPDWQPGKQHGEAVDVSYTIPIQFKLH